MYREVLVWLRSLVFNLLFFGWTAVLFGLVLWALLPFDPRWMQKAVRFWSRSILWLARKVVGISFRYVGVENIPSTGALIACKHQSAWDTFVFFDLFPAPVYIIKRALMYAPFYGWYAAKVGMIVAPKGGTKALRDMLRQVEQATDQQRPVIIFPEGERVVPRQHVPLKGGTALIAAKVKAPVVPAALNSGLFWGKRSFLKRPGTITVEFFPPLPGDLSKKALLARLEKTIQSESDRLEDEVRGASA